MAAPDLSNDNAAENISRKRSAAQKEERGGWDNVISPSLLTMKPMLQAANTKAGGRKLNGAKRQKLSTSSTKGTSAETAISLDDSFDSETDIDELAPPLPSSSSSSSFIVHSQNLWFDPCYQDLRARHMRDVHFAPATSPPTVSICQVS